MYAKNLINHMHRVWHAGWRFAAVSYRRKPGDSVWVLEFRREHAGEDRLVTEGPTLVEAWTAAADRT